MIIAIDGPAGAGKSSVSRAVAELFSFAYIDSGAMYRALTLAALEAGFEPKQHSEKIAALAQTLPLKFEENGRKIFIDNRDVSALIREPGISEATSQIAAIGAVRPAIVEQQRRLGREGEARHGGAVLEGRDIQTVVFPDAEIKIFLTATPRTRAQRRLKDWKAEGRRFDLAQLEKEITQRDQLDSSRADSPLRAAEDAVHLPTDELTADEVVRKIAALVEKYFQEHQEHPACRK